MEEKKLNELKDEALDAVTGGAYFEYNMQTKQWDVFDKDGKKVSTHISKVHAERAARSLSEMEAQGGRGEPCY